jgi:flagellar FliL protein
MTMAVSAVKKETTKNPNADGASASTPHPKKSRKLLIIISILILLCTAAGGGAYWYMGQNKQHKTAEAKPQPLKPPVYVPLEPFTVNLQIEDHPQFLQTGLSLKVSDNAVADALKLHMPEVRDRILLYLSARKPSELLTVEGKRKVGSDIVDIVNAILSPPAPKSKAKGKAKAKAKSKSKESEEEKPAEETVAEEDEEKAETEAAAPPPPPPLPILSVLFTSFIVQ